MSKESVDELLKQRQEDYGDALVNFATIGRVWGALLQIDDIPPHQVGLMMDAFKTVRIFSNPDKDDSWDDKEGYTKLARKTARES